jgi:prolipoprotein diacylglyceryltransferase
MRRVLFRWRGITVWSYPALLYVGLVAGVVASNVAAHTAGLDAFRVYVATLVLVPVALIGARLLYVAANWPLYRRNLARVWDGRDGGAAMYGGLYVALGLSVPLLAALRLPLGVFWDVTMFAILTGMIFTRIGCLLNGCCAGRPSTSWLSVSLPDHRGTWARRIPTQALEAAGAALLLGAAMLGWRWLPMAGGLFLLVTAAYCGGRLLLESWREPEPGAKRWNVYHALSVVMMVVSLTAMVALWPRPGADHVEVRRGLDGERTDR